MLQQLGAKYDDSTTEFPSREMSSLDNSASRDLATSYEASDIGNREDQWAVAVGRVSHRSRLWTRKDYYL